MSIRLIVATLSASLVATPVAAQLCAGTASFAGRPVRAGGSAEFVNSASTLGINAALGRPNAFFGQLGVARTSQDGESSLGARVMGGYQMPLGTQNKLQFCPRIGVGHISGPNNVGGSNIDISGNEFLFDATIGLLAAESPGFDFVPSMGISYTTQYLTFDGTPGGDTHVKGTFGTIVFAPGLVFNRMITVQPNVMFPFGVEGRDVTYGFTVSFNFASN